MTLPEIDIPSELFYIFNEVTFHDEDHKYYYNGKKLISTTGLLEKYKSSFDKKYIDIKAEEFNINPLYVDWGWSFINEVATTYGSIIHDYAENLFLNKVFPYPKELVKRKFGIDPVYEKFLISKKHVDKFYKDSLYKLIPIKTELVLFDKEYLIAGMLDILFYNIKTEKFEIWDYKTNSNNKAFTTSSYFMKGFLSSVPKDDLNIYSLQLSIYKYILRKYIPNIDLGDSYLVWVSYKNDNYKIVKCIDYEGMVENLFKDFKFNNSGMVA